jgi:hypothetical protein
MNTCTSDRVCLDALKHRSEIVNNSLIILENKIENNRQCLISLLFGIYSMSLVSIVSIVCVMYDVF